MVFLLTGALLVRLGWGLHLPSVESALGLLPDQLEYLELGRNLLRSGSLEFFDQRFEQTVRAYRTPGYPALVALCGGNIQAIRIVQALLDTSTVLATFLLARRWLSPRASFFAAFIVAVNPFLIYFTGLILTETLFIAMLAWGMLLLVTRPWLGMLLLALSVLVRPSGMLLPVALVLALRGIGWQPALQMLLLIAVLCPWAIRNRLVLNRWVWTTTNSGITQYDGLNPQADGSSNQSFVAQMPELREMSEVDRSEHLGQLALEYAQDHPARVLKLAAVKIARTWSPIPLSRDFGTRPLYVLVSIVYSLPLDLLVVWGLWSGKLSRSTKVFLVMPAIYFTAVHALSVGSLRYRIPAEVPMAIIVAGCRWPVARRDGRIRSLTNDR